MNSGWERRANVNIICSVVCLLHVVFFEDVIYGELLFVETNHRQALLMEVAVVMTGEGPLCVCVCVCVCVFVSVCISTLGPTLQSTQCVSLTFESITLTFPL